MGNYMAINVLIWKDKKNKKDKFLWYLWYLCDSIKKISLSIREIRRENQRYLHIQTFTHSHIHKGRFAQNLK